MTSFFNQESSLRPDTEWYWNLLQTPCQKIKNHLISFHFIDRPGGIGIHSKLLAVQKWNVYSVPLTLFTNISRLSKKQFSLIKVSHCRLTKADSVSVQANCALAFCAGTGKNDVAVHSKS